MSAQPTQRCECGYEVPFDPEVPDPDLYCPSCGRAVDLPQPADPAASPIPQLQTATDREAADPQQFETLPAAPIPDESVFSAETLSRLQGEIIDEVHCLCGQSIPVSLEEVSDVIYCPSCGGEVRVQPLAAVGAEPDKSQPQTEVPSSLQPLTQTTRIRYRWIVAAMLIMGALGTAGVFVSGDGLQGPANEKKSPWLYRVERTEAESIATFDPEAVTVEAIQDLKRAPDPFHILAVCRNWRTGLLNLGVPTDDHRLNTLDELALEVLANRRPSMLEMIEELRSVSGPSRSMQTADRWRNLLKQFNVPDDDPRLLALNAVTEELLSTLDPITLETIERLKQRSDAAETLLQARLWQQRLREQNVPESDDRRAALNRLITELVERLTPAGPEEPDFFTEMDTRLNQAAEALSAGDLPAARKHITEAEELLDKHPEKLQPYQQRLEFLRETIARRTNLHEAAQPLFDLLVEAERAAENGDVTSALQQQARARFQARHMKMTVHDAEKLKQTVRNLLPKIRLARGRRAVQEAKRCHELGDLAIRNWLLRRAYSLLPGLPEDQVRPLLAQLQPWKEEALARKPSSDDLQPKTDFGRKLQARTSFEAVLEPYAQTDWDVFIAAARDAKEAFTAGGPPSKQWEKRLDRLVLHGLEVEVTARLEAAEGQTDPAKTRQLLSEASRMLSQAQPWDHLDGWRTLHAKLQEYWPHEPSQLNPDG